MFLLLNSFVEFSKDFDISLISEKKDLTDFFYIKFAKKAQTTEKHFLGLRNNIENTCHVKNFGFKDFDKNSFGIEISAIESVIGENNFAFPNFNTETILNRNVNLQTQIFKDREIFLGTFLKRFSRRTDQGTKIFLEFLNDKNEKVLFDYAKLLKYDFVENQKYEIVCKGKIAEGKMKYPTMQFEIKLLSLN
jgi:hypothetical protein